MPGYLINLMGEFNIVNVALCRRPYKLVLPGQNSNSKPPNIGRFPLNSTDRNVGINKYALLGVKLFCGIMFMLYVLFATERVFFTQDHVGKVIISDAGRNAKWYELHRMSSNRKAEIMINEKTLYVPSGVAEMLEDQSAATVKAGRYTGIAYSASVSDEKEWDLFSIWICLLWAFTILYALPVLSELELIGFVSSLSGIVLFFHAFNV